MKTGALVYCYADALFSAAVEIGQEQEIGDQLSFVLEQIASQPDFAGLLQDRRVPAPRKREFMHKVFSQSLHPYLLNLFSILFDKNRESELGNIGEAYHDILRKKQGLRPATLTTAIAPSDQQVEQLSASLSRLYDSKIVFTCNVDPSLLGGAIIKMDDMVIDGSLKTRLTQLRGELCK